jgi:hypothetical protein
LGSWCSAQSSSCSLAAHLLAAESTCNGVKNDYVYDFFMKEIFLYLTLTFTPHQTGMFLEILFKIRNQHKILRKKVE